MLEKMLRIDEGVRTKVYWDHLGYPTIGIGHLIIKEVTKDMTKINRILSEHVRRNVTNGTITNEEVTMLLNSDIEKIRVTIKKYTDLNKAYIKLDPVRKMAIENMCFQLGVAGVSKFRKMVSALNVGNWDEAKRQALDSSWSKQTPVRAKRVADVLRTGSLSQYGL